MPLIIQRYRGPTVDFAVLIRSATGRCNIHQSAHLFFLLNSQYPEY